MNQELAHSNRLKDEFLSTLTHELRTPMNGVIGSLELMQTVDLDPELAQYQQTAAGSARDMMRMVNGILTLTELQAGRLKVQREDFSLHGVLDRLRLQFAANAMSKALDFEIEVATGLPDRGRDVRLTDTSMTIWRAHQTRLWRRSVLAFGRLLDRSSADQIDEPSRRSRTSDCSAPIGVFD